MGYSNAPRPVADVDYVYAIATQVCGACIAAAIFSNIAQMINKGDAAGARYQYQLDQIRECHTDLPIARITLARTACTHSSQRPPPPFGAR